MTFAESLKSHRARLGIKQTEMAQLLGISYRTMYEWESGRANPHETTQEGAVARLIKIKAKNL